MKSPREYKPEDKNTQIQSNKQHVGPVHHSQVPDVSVFQAKNNEDGRTVNQFSTIFEDSPSSKQTVQLQSAFSQQSEAKEAAKPNNTGLPDKLKTGIESLSGYSMDDVRVHYNSSKPAQLNASAYAQGTDIHLASGQEKHLSHEAWHVVQQKQGRVEPTKQFAGVAVNDNKNLEHEADVMGKKAIQGKASGLENNNRDAKVSGEMPVQRMVQTEVGTVIGIIQSRFQQFNPDETVFWNDIVKYTNKRQPPLSRMSAQQVADFMTEIGYVGVNLQRTPQLRRMSTGTAVLELEERVGLERRNEILKDPYKTAKYFDIMEAKFERSRVVGNKLHQGILTDETMSADSRLEYLFVHAELAAKEFNQKLMGVASKSSYAEYELAPIKGWERAHEKMEDKYGFEPKRILDLIRGSIIFDNVTHLVNALAHARSDFKVVRTKSTVGENTDTGYQDMKLNVELSNGHVAELQFHLRSMIDAKHDGGHALYRFIRAYDEGKGYTPDSKKAATLVPQLRELIARLQSISGTAMHIEMLNKIIFKIKRGKTVRLNTTEGDLIKEISRLVYHQARQSIGHEISNNSGVKSILDRID